MGRTLPRWALLLYTIIFCLVPTRLLVAQEEQPSTGVLIKQLKSEDPKARARAARLLSKKTDLDALPALLDALRDPAAHPWAVQGIHAHQTKEAVPVLVKALSHELPEARWRAVSLLGNIGDNSVAPKLLPLMKDEHVPVRAWTAWALGELKYKKAFDALVQAAEAPEPRVRSAALAALGEMDNPKAVPVLLEGLRDVLQEVRWSAIYSLGRYPCPASVSALQLRLSDDNPTIRRRAMISLIRIGEPAKEAIHGILLSNDKGLRLELDIVLAQLCSNVRVGRTAAPALEMLVAQTKGTTQYRAGAALHRLNREKGGVPVPRQPEPEDVPEGDEQYQTLISRAACIDDDGAFAARCKLIEIGVPALPSVLRYLERRAKRGRVGPEFLLAEIIVQMGPEAVPALTSVLLDPHSRIRATAADTLGKIGDRSAVQPLCDVLTEAGPDRMALGRGFDDWRLLEACAEALGEIGDRNAVMALIAVAQTNNAEPGSCCRAAIEALGKIGDRTAIPTLLVLLDSTPNEGDLGPARGHPEDEDLRNAAAEAMGLIGDPATIPALEDALEKANGKLKRDIERAIRRIETVNE